MYTETSTGEILMHVPSSFLRMKKRQQPWKSSVSIITTPFLQKTNNLCNCLFKTMGLLNQTTQGINCVVSIYIEVNLSNSCWLAS